MDLLQIRYVLAIADYESMNAAAEKLFVSQSALSMSYKRLEQELGISLFRKQGRRLELTSAGELFCEKARTVMAAMQDLRCSMQEVAADQARQIYVCTEAVDYTNEAIRLYRRSHPDLFLQQVRGSTEEIRSMLSSGTVDFAITLSPDFGPGMDAVLLLEEPMLALVSPRDPLAERTAISLKELEHRQIITLREGLAVNRMFQDFFQQAGVQPGHSIEVNDPESIVIQVSKDFGFSFIPESVANLNGMEQLQVASGTRTIPLEETLCRRQVYLITADGRKIRPAVADFLAFLSWFGAYTAENHCYPAKPV